MLFASDNWAGAAPEIVEAIAQEARSFGQAYGESPTDKRVEKLFSDIFERDVAVFFLGTGSAANALALALVNKPGGLVLCHRQSHILEDECGAVEYLTGGGRLLPVEGQLGKIDLQHLRSALSKFSPGSVHSGQLMAVSLTQQTEAGTIYSVEELGALCAAAREHNLPVHMDGARFVNALVNLKVSPAEMTWKAGVDILSFGGTKNGCVGAEALVVFDPARAQAMPYLRKRAGQLFSKSRFISAQFEAYVRDRLWLRLASHANAMAELLRAGLARSSRAEAAWPTGGNEIFASLRKVDATRLLEAGAAFYEWPQPDWLAVAEDRTLFRFVTSFATRAEEIENFLQMLEA